MNFFKIYMVKLIAEGNYTLNQLVYEKFQIYLSECMQIYYIFSLLKHPSFQTPSISPFWTIKIIVNTSRIKKHHENIWMIILKAGGCIHSNFEGYIYCLQIGKIHWFIYQTRFSKRTVYYTLSYVFPSDGNTTLILLSVIATFVGKMWSTGGYSLVYLFTPELFPTNLS